MANTWENAIYHNGPKMKEKTWLTLLNTHTHSYTEAHTHTNSLLNGFIDQLSWTLKKKRIWIFYKTFRKELNCIVKPE